MRRGPLLTLAIAAVLSGAPSSAYATDGGGASGPADHPTPTAATDPASEPAGLAFEPVEIAMGLGGVGAVLALLAWSVLALGRRRRVEAAPSERRRDPPASPTAAEEHVTAALHRRTLRRGHVRLEEDPIIASMGVGSPSRAVPNAGRARRSSRRSPPT